MRILRHEVPVDGSVHDFWLSGAILHASARTETVVEFWALDSGGPTTFHRLLVVGAGEVIEDGLVHMSTVLTPSRQADPRAGYVWHLMRLK